MVTKKTPQYLFLFLLVGLVWGCSSTVVQKQTYFALKNSRQADITLFSGASQIVIHRVDLPKYLRQRAIVRRFNGQQIKPLLGQFWLQRPSRMLPRFLAKELAVTLKQPVGVYSSSSDWGKKTIVDLTISQLLADEKALTLRASYRLVKPNALISHDFSTTVVLKNNTTQALVNAHQQALARLVRDMGKSL